MPNFFTLLLVFTPLFLITIPRFMGISPPPEYVRLLDLVSIFAVLLPANYLLWFAWSWFIRTLQKYKKIQ